MTYKYEVVNIEQKIMLEGSAATAEELIRQLLILRSGGWHIVSVTGIEDHTVKVATGIRGYLEGQNAQQTGEPGATPGESEQCP